MKNEIRTEREEAIAALIELCFNRRIGEKGGGGGQRGDFLQIQSIEKDILRICKRESTFCFVGANTPSWEEKYFF